MILAVIDGCGVLVTESAYSGLLGFENFKMMGFNTCVIIGVAYICASCYQAPFNKFVFFFNKDG